MSTDRDVTRIVRSWLDEGVNVLPDRVLGATLDQLPTTPQRRATWWPARRISQMNSVVVRIGLAAAAIAVVALVSYQLGSRSIIGGPGPSTSPAGSSPAGSASETPAPPAGTVWPPGTPFISGGKTVRIDGVPLSFTVPEPGYEVRGGLGRARWESAGSSYMTQNMVGPQGAETVILWTSFPGGLYADPCAYLLGQPAGASAAELAAAVATAPGVELVAEPAAVMVGGHAAVRTVVRVREDLGCDPAYFYTYPVPSGYGGAFWLTTEPGDTITVWIVEVEGKRLFIEAETRAEVDDFHYPPGARSIDEDIQEIIDSIQFE